jgi:hypothetical protein
VYLRATVDKCASRIAARKRDGEDGIGRAYLSKLHDAHERYVSGAKASSSSASGYERVLELDLEADGEATVEDAARRTIEFCDAVHVHDTHTYKRICNRDPAVPETSATHY